MRHARVLVLAALAVPVIAAVAFAQSAVTPIPDPPPVRIAPLEVDLSKTTWGDAKAGQTKAAACAACHGPDGNPAVAMYPRIAGQTERYVAHQVALIASGERNSGMSAVMVPFVKDLTAQDMRDLGAYFATQKSQGLKFYEVGEKLYRGGDIARGVPACMACHGPSGSGNPGPAYPRLGGQHAEYVARRLKEYQAGTTQERNPALFNIMAQVAHPLTEQEIQALASYLQGLHDRADDAAAAQAPAAGTPARS
ncbi:c-type cytochrome [Xanthomonas hortorum]|uniref:c-type cytochrome n=1 Tax=Xanthomonas hortorum TaxID=56454 RepID=UPI00062D4AB9|nr:c-type cytochrome [Xanthomonas hortorum]KLA95645.1 cytochrome C [Xanthomonas hortorum pv. gardneri]